MTAKLLSKAHVFAVAVLVFACYITANIPTITPTGPFATPATTPTILFDGKYVPEESPDGAPPVGWLDNSPLYRDGWVLLVDDSQTPPTVQWRSPK